MPKREKILVAMSGGVDSSVTAALLQEQGYDCLGVFMCLGSAESDHTGQHGCCSPADARDAKEVAHQLGIEFEVLNFQKDMDQIVDYFVHEYSRGRTPNPCIQCNNRLKFGKLMDYADIVGAQFVATGHYARIEQTNGHRHLHRAADNSKDQSYVLFGMDRDTLQRAMFPLGRFPKDQVRDMAQRYGLSQVQAKPDSQDICFVPDHNYSRLLERRRPELVRTGDVVDKEGHVLGQHNGIHNFTTGQRRGLGVALGKPAYVVEINAAQNQVVLGNREDLLSRRMVVKNVNWLIDPTPTEPFSATVQIRYNHRGAPGKVSPPDDSTSNRDQVLVDFDQPVSAITPGQAAVFYDKDERVIGGGWIHHGDS
ncbi:MAG: tRNA 2-thiouridine(34) synthase MnmA [Planctomycetes bacterium]|nr:tRNA 2-thiouridine(34) synthase MnmA [Planctomycetota bacterium]